VSQQPTVGVIGQFTAGSSLAHAINVTKTAGGFARLGHRVVICCQRPRDGVTCDDLARDYAEPALQWVFAPERLPVIDGDPSGAFGVWAAGVCRDEGADFVYARHFHAALAAGRLGLCTVLETHAHVGDLNPLLEECFLATRGEGVLNDSVRPRIAALVTISRTLRNEYVSRGADKDRVHVVPDGVDVELFAPRAGSDRPAEFPTSKRVVLYAGHLYDYKGVPTMLDAARLLPDVVFALLGGLPEDVERTRDRVAAKGLANVLLLGPRPHAQVARYLWHADALLLPPSAHHASARWTSPVKLGEYLASGQPIVASGISALRDWVDEPAVRWFVPDDGSSMAESIGSALSESSGAASERTRVAILLARRLSYRSRAAAIHAFARSAGERECSRPEVAR